MIRQKKTPSCMKRIHVYLPERLLMDLARYTAQHDEYRMSQSLRRLLAEGLARAKKEQ